MTASCLVLPYSDSNVLPSLTKQSGKQLRFSWVTRLSLSAENVTQVMRAGRARWRIENETFNTLKNQGYNFGHNYGHGDKNLCSVLTILMMLAFLIDQVQQLTCKVWQRARRLIGNFQAFCNEVRVLIKFGVWETWESLFVFIGDPHGRAPPGEPGGIRVF